MTEYQKKQNLGSLGACYLDQGEMCDDDNESMVQVVLSSLICMEKSILNETSANEHAC